MIYVLGTMALGQCPLTAVPVSDSLFRPEFISAGPIRIWRPVGTIIIRMDIPVGMDIGTLTLERTGHNTITNVLGDKHSRSTTIREFLPDMWATAVPIAPATMPECLAGIRPVMADILAEAGEHTMLPAPLPAVITAHLPARADKTFPISEIGTRSQS